MNKKERKLKDSFDYILKDFEIDPNPQVIWEDFNNGNTTVQTIREYHISFANNPLSFHPYIVFIIFVFLKRFKFFGKSEKIAWEIPIKYKGTSFILTHRKFGFHVISNTENETVTKHGLEAINQIQKAIPMAEQMIEPIIKSRVSNRQITLDNQYINIFNRYTFFRKNAKKEFEATNEKQKRTSKKSNAKTPFSFLMGDYNQSINRLQTGSYYLTAMLDSYFCLLEHTFVLLLPFIDDPKINNIDVETFISLKWKDKYKNLFSLSTDKKALLLLERLEKIKEQLRNPFAHGHFLKNGHSFYVHMEQLGAIPMNLTRTNQQFKYFFLGSAPSFKEICECFDYCDKFLYLHKTTKYGMQFIKSGLDIAFDKSSTAQYKSAMKSRSGFDEFIKYNAYQEDNAANMDW